MLSAREIDQVTPTAKHSAPGGQIAPYLKLLFYSIFTDRVETVLFQIFQGGEMIFCSSECPQAAKQKINF